jgi:hypothetical protein
MNTEKRKFARKFKNCGIRGVDAEKISAEIRSIGGEITAEDYLGYAALHPESESHKCFEWDDANAGREYRLAQARLVLRSVVIEWETVTAAGEKEIVVTREFESVADRSNPGGSVYVPLCDALSDDEYRGQIFAEIGRDIEALKQKARSYSWAVKNAVLFAGLLDEAAELIGGAGCE